MHDSQKDTQKYSALREDIQTLMRDITYSKARIAFVKANMRRRTIDDTVEGKTGDMCVNLEDELSAVFVEKSAISLSVESKCLKNILYATPSDAISTKYKIWIEIMLEKVESTDRQLYKLTEEKNNLCVEIQELEKQIIREKNEIVKKQNKIKKQMEIRRQLTNNDAYQRERGKLIRRVATMNTVRNLTLNLCFATNNKLSEHPGLLELTRTLRKPIILELL